MTETVALNLHSTMKHCNDNFFFFLSQGYLAPFLTQVFLYQSIPRMLIVWQKYLFVWGEVSQARQPIWAMLSMAGLSCKHLTSTCAHTFIRNWQLPFLGLRKGENDRWNYFMISLHANYSRTLMARTPLGPWKFVRDSGSSSHGRLLLVPHQEA